MYLLFLFPCFLFYIQVFLSNFFLFSSVSFLSLFLVVTVNRQNDGMSTILEKAGSRYRKDRNNGCLDKVCSFLGKIPGHYAC